MVEFHPSPMGWPQQPIGCRQRHLYPWQDYFLYGLRWNGVPNGLDRRLCAVGTFIGALFEKIGKFTVPDFIGERYYSKTARIVAVLCALLVSFTYVAGQMRGVGVVFSVSWK